MEGWRSWLLFGGIVIEGNGGWCLGSVGFVAGWRLEFGFEAAAWLPMYSRWLDSPMEARLE